MNNLKYVWMALVVVAIIAIGAYSFPKAAVQVAEELVGRFGTAFPNGICTGAGCEVDTVGEAEFNGVLTSGTSTVETLVTGGYVVSSSTSNTSETMAAALLLGGTLLLTPNTGATTYTLPASSTITAMVPNQGDIKELIIRNSTTTLNLNGFIQFAGNTGTILETSSSSDSFIADKISGGKGAKMTFWRSATSSTQADVYVWLEPFE